MIRSPRAAQRNGLISKENFERFGSRPNPYILGDNKPKSDRRDYCWCVFNVQSTISSVAPELVAQSDAEDEAAERAQLAEEPVESEPEPAEQARVQQASRARRLLAVRLSAWGSLSLSQGLLSQRVPAFPF
jgi:hypothetical protein